MSKKKAKADPTQPLFQDPTGQVDFLQKSLEDELASKGPVKCLGMTFENDEQRRVHFLEKLREKLKDPEFRKIEGFPIGDDEDILALSDPPYYTACPNPFIADVIKQHGKPYRSASTYSKEPFAVDVSEGKNDAIYGAHSYHTKVPPKAIMRYILHYTEPGDVIFDGFCGTGMVGVAARLCADTTSVQNLGFKVKATGEVLDADGITVSRLGARNSILYDLSPAATFISSNYCGVSSPQQFANDASRLIASSEDKCRWMYETKTKSGQGYINYTIWSDVFFCPHCQEDIIFWDAAMDEDEGTVRDEFRCPSCRASVTKGALERRMETDVTHHGTKVTRIKKVPISIDFLVNESRKQKKFEPSDSELLARIMKEVIPIAAPTYPLDPESEQYKRDALHLRGIVDVADFCTRRNLIALATCWEQVQAVASQGRRRRLWFLLTSVQWLGSKMYRHRTTGGGGQQGKLTIPSLMREQNVFRLLRDKRNDIQSALSQMRYNGDYAIGTGSSTSLKHIPDNSIDYIFTDPPFGGNLFYSDLNSIWEGWLRVVSNSKAEAVVHKARTKKPTTLQGYGELMRAAFSEACRILKPGRWITVEFHNSSNAVWNTIQQALNEANFVIADVRTLDKKQGTFKQVTEATTPKQDLVITAYKPNGGLEARFKLEAGTEEGVWDFIRTHLRQLPVFVSKQGQAEVVAERLNYLLFDRMVAFHVQRGVMVPTSASGFHAGLTQRFPERDGMFFLPDQVAEYDKKRMTVKEVLQLEIFITDEATAIEWLKQQLTRKTQTFQEIHPQFMRELGGWHKHERPLELTELLGQNFLRYGGEGEVPSQIHSYLSTNFKECRNLAKDDLALMEKAEDRWYVPDPNKAGDLERLRDRALLREFWEYLPPGYAPAMAESAEGYIPGMEPKPSAVPRGKKMKIIRMEAVRAGFKQCWQSRDYRTIIAVAQRIPEDVLQEDPKLLMWYDQALTRTGGEQ